MSKKASSAPKSVEAIKHGDAKRKNIPSAEQQSILQKEVEHPKHIRYPRNTDLDPQLVWRGKDEQDWSDLVVNAPPLYIQEKVHPKALIDDLLRQSKETAPEVQFDLFNDFNGIPKGADKTEFYAHDQNWSNRMILGDSLQVMASLAEREGLRGRVQCIYFDPPYGIKFNSNFQWSTTSRDVKDGKADHITREPEQVKAFRDTWRDGIHSYLTYLRDRLTVARDLLTDSGSIFVQIGDENVHLIRSLLDEVFGSENLIAQITVEKTSGQTQVYLAPVTDYVLWYAKRKEQTKYRAPWGFKRDGGAGFREYSRIQHPDLTRRVMTNEEIADEQLIPKNAIRYRQGDLTSQGAGREKGEGAASWFAVPYRGAEYRPSMQRRWSTNEMGMQRLLRAERVELRGTGLAYVRFLDDFPLMPVNNIWDDVKFSSRSEEKTYVVQTSAKVVERCILMTTDPGDLVLDPTCGSGTTATVAEQWGRRWITIDTSRVALALARARIMGARYPFYLLADSREGQLKEAEVTRTAPSSQPVQGNIRHGFVYERAARVSLKSIASNAEIDVIWEQWQGKLAPLAKALNDETRMTKAEMLQEWEIPRAADAKWSAKAQKLHSEWWEARIARQKEIDASIAAKAEFEYLYDKPYDDKKKVRVAGPFTVESLSPHRVLGVDEQDELIDTLQEGNADYLAKQTFPQMVLENLKTSGVQQAHKEDRITFTDLTPWPGALICGEGRYQEGEANKRAAIFIGPEFGTVQRADLAAAAREAGDAGFDVLIACAFNYEAHATEFSKLGRIPVLKARMNADLHMAEDLKNTGKGNLFVIFGEPDVMIWEGGSKAIDAELAEVAERTPTLSAKLETLTVKLKLLKKSKAAKDAEEAKGTKEEAVKADKERDDVKRLIDETERQIDRDNRFTLNAPKIPNGKLVIEVKGVDVFKPQTGEVISNGADGIACWFIDTDYNEESFFVRHAYFLGANDPYSALKTTLKAEINPEAWATLNSDTSRPFEKPKQGRIAVKVINHLGDEVMKVFRVH
ncbi:MAG: site-specific DNA-methyltransferase [Verrucomicrobiaceae bacterium]|nr:site-specific DNA-methyltransferase [Verrucomicrobiaceae bacterium]